MLARDWATPLGSSSSLSDPVNSASSSSHTAILVGSVLGGVVLIACLAISFFLYRKHHRKQSFCLEKQPFPQPLQDTRTTSLYEQRVHSALTQYPRPDSMLSTHSDASYAPNVLGMVHQGNGGFPASWKPAAALPSLPEAADYIDAEQVTSGHCPGLGGRRPSAHHDAVSWPRRGRLNTGTELYGIL